MFAFNEPFGSAIFCDDIRTEIGGKYSYIGVYQGAIHAPSFPVTIPKFGIFLTFNEPVELAKNRNWAIPLSIFFPGDLLEKPFISAEIPAPTPEAFAASRLPNDPDVPPLLQIGIAMLMAPLVLREVGRIKIRANYQNSTIKLGSIRVETAPGSNDTKTTKDPVTANN